MNTDCQCRGASAKRRSIWAGLARASFSRKAFAERKRCYMITALVLLAPLGALADDLDFTPLQYLVVLQDARKKPLDSVATEMLQRITGKRAFVDPETGHRREALDVWVSMWLQTRDWSKVPVILLTYQPLKAKLGLPADQKYFSYEQLATPKFESLIEPIMQKAQMEEEKQGNLTRDEREAKTVFGRLNALAAASGLGSVAVVAPPAGSQKREWVSIDKAATYYGERTQTELTALMGNLAQAYLQRDPIAFSAASRALVAGVRNLNPPAYPSIDQLRREIHYNSFHPFGKAWMLYLLAFVWLVVTWRSQAAGIYWVGIAAFVAGAAVHAYGFYLRILISGRPPVTNMYESVVWVSFGAAAFALILELIYRQRYYVTAVAPISVLMLLLADQLPAVLDPSIGPLTPVLRSNYWLSIHVPTITLGYAAFAVALGVGHIALAYHIRAPFSPRLLRLEHYVYRAMQIGVLFLAAGTILGGIWANEAWGRFWGWDPKETWALIALLSYLIPLHGRLAGWMGNFALCVSSVICFMAVLMAWYGVNFVLGKGLHSYGFGTGGFPYVLGFVGIELAYCGFAALRRKQAHPAKLMTKPGIAVAR